MGRQERKLNKIKAKEELQKRKRQHDWDNSSGSKKIATYLLIAIAGAVVFGLIVSSASDNEKSQPAQSEAATEGQSIAGQVKIALDKLGDGMKSELASTSPGGYQGDIISVEPAVGKASVKVGVSTYFKDSGDVVNGGQGIARKIFSNICLDVPELESLYVVSGSGLDSRSVYRSDFPFCK